MSGGDYPLVLISWVDSGLSFAHSWNGIEEIAHRAKEWNGIVETCGFMVHEDEQCVVVALSKDVEQESTNLAGCMLINRPNIQTILRLTPTLALDGEGPLVSAHVTSSSGWNAIPSALPSEAQDADDQLQLGLDVAGP